MKSYHVHIYATVRVKVWNVEAESQLGAIEKAFHACDLYEMFPCRTTDNERPEPDGEPTAESGGFAEEISGFLVDEADDPECIHTRYYDDNNLPKDVPDAKMVNCTVKHKSFGLQD